MSFSRSQLTSAMLAQYGVGADRFLAVRAANQDASSNEIVVILCSGLGLRLSNSRNQDSDRTKQKPHPKAELCGSSTDGSADTRTQ